jgi:mRNA interferase HigB
MRLIDIKTLRQFWLRHRDAERPLTKWYQTAKEAAWHNLDEVRAVYPHADAVSVGSGKTATVFNIGGNKYRLITAIHYNTQIIYLMMVLTHQEYDAGSWKKVL